MGLFRFMFYPLVRAGEQLNDSKRRLKASAGAAKKQFHSLTDAAAIENPAARFAALVEENEWTEKELRDQLIAVRRTKYFAMFAIVLGVFFVVVLAVTVPAYLAILLIPAAGFVIALGTAMILKYTLFQEQLRRKSLVTLKTVLSDQGFWGLVFK